MLNTQRPEPATDLGGDIDLHSMFNTIQGEGPFQGMTAIFIRLAGCSIQCPFCDTEYTNGRRITSVAEIVSMVQERLTYFKSKCVVITGGEPFRQNIDPLLKSLSVAASQLHIQIETNGVAGISEQAQRMLATKSLTVVCSPKTQRVHESMRWASCWKYVLQAGFIDPDDGLPTLALGHKAKPRVARPERYAEIWVNPMDAKSPHENSANMLATAESAMKYGYRLGCQIHKFYDLE